MPACRRLFCAIELKSELHARLHTAFWASWYRPATRKRSLICQTTGDGQGQRGWDKVQRGAGDMVWMHAARKRQTQQLRRRACMQRACTNADLSKQEGEGCIRWGMSRSACRPEQRRGTRQDRAAVGQAGITAAGLQPPWLHWQLSPPGHAAACASAAGPAQTGAPLPTQSWLPPLQSDFLGWAPLTSSNIS